MSVTEGATPHILATQTHVEPLIEQATNGQGFGRGPVDVLPQLKPLEAITDQTLLKTIIDELYIVQKNDEV